MDATGRVAADEPHQHRVNSHQNRPGSGGVVERHRRSRKIVLDFRFLESMSDRTWIREIACQGVLSESRFGISPLPAFCGGRRGQSRLVPLVAACPPPEETLSGTLPRHWACPPRGVKHPTIRERLAEGAGRRRVVDRDFDKDFDEVVDEVRDEVRDKGFRPEADRQRQRFGGCTTGLGIVGCGWGVV